MGAPRLQPGDGAADCAAGERHWRLWSVRRRWRSSSAASAYRRADDRARALAAARSLSRWCARAPASGAACAVAAHPLTTAGSPIRVGSRPGQRRAGTEMGSGAGRRDPAALHRHDARSDRRGSAVRHLARVVDAVQLRGRAARGRRDPPAGARSEHHAARSAAIRSSDPAPLTVGPPPRSRYYNAAFLVRPDGTDRRGLSEDAPGAVRRVRAAQVGCCSSSDRSSQAVSDFSPGHGAGPAAGRRHMRQHRHLLRGDLPEPDPPFVRDGSELLTTITNDAWYGRSSAAYQHWEQASMRAIEEGRYLARAANTGISGFVDPYGRVLQRRTCSSSAVVDRRISASSGAHDLQPHRRRGRVAVAGAHRRRAAASCAPVVRDSESI